MTTPTNETHHRSQTETDEISRFIELALKRYDLTHEQARAIGAGMFKKFGAPFADDNASLFNAYASENATLFRKPPTLHQAHAWACAQLGENVSAQTRVTEWRKLERMSPDELLALVPADAKLIDAVAPSAARTGEKLAHEMDPVELMRLVEEKTGLNIRNSLPSKLRTYGEALADASRPAATPYLDEVAMRVRQGGTFQSIRAETRLNAHREAAAIGETVESFLRKKASA